MRKSLTYRRAEARGRRRSLAPVRLQFHGMEAGARVSGNAGLEEALRVCLHGWAFDRQPHGSSLIFGTAFALPNDPGGFVYDSPALSRPLTDLSLTGAVCALIADLSVGWCDVLAEGMGMHCGAVIFDQSLIAFSGPTRVGKSTLMSRLSAEPGVTVFCDDDLPVSRDGRGIALGIAPRLRLPLPPNASAAFRSHLVLHDVLSDGQYAYLRVPTLARHGQTAPLGALVILHRGPPGTAARLHHMARATALHHFLSQSLTDLHSADHAYAMADRITGNLPAFSLVYSDLEDVTTLLHAVFGPMTGRRPPVHPPLPDTLLAEVAPPVPPAPFDQPLCCQPGIALRQTDGGGFLWRPGDGVLWRLNPVAAAIWTLLTDAGPQGSSARALATTLAFGFPEPDPSLIEAETCALLGQLLAHEFAKSA